MFAIRCSINQATAKFNVFKIVVVTDSIYAAKRIFNLFSHPLQIQSVALLKDLCLFFSKDSNNSIVFWECPSCLNWHLHKAVNLETKVFHPTSLFSSKTLWDYSKKVECNNIANIWKMMFQTSDSKGKQFLKLRDDDSNDIEPSHVKSSLWLQAFGQLNILCMRTMRVITNHAPIGEYKLRSFPREEFKCPCSVYPIKSRRHILHDCSRFNDYWNPRRDLLSHFLMFLKTNPNVFAFLNNINSTSISRSYN